VLNINLGKLFTIYLNPCLLQRVSNTELVVQDTVTSIHTLPSSIRCRIFLISRGFLMIS